MKLKKLISSLICTSLVLSSFVVVSANNVIVDESPISETDASTGTENEWTTEESNLSDVEVTYQQSSNYVVTIPKTIALDSKKQATYSIKVTGDVDVNQRVYVSPVDVINTTENIDFYMKDQNGKKADVVATVTQNKKYWSSEEVASGYEETNNSISAPDLTSGTWKGTFQVEIKLQTFNNTGNEDNKQQVAGLYDADDNLLVSWDESGIDETCSNVKTVITNTYPQTAKVVISDSVMSINQQAFQNCRTLTEVVIPNSVTNIGNAAFSNCTSLKNVNIPNTITSIGGYLFNGTAITSIEIPDSVTNIDWMAFFDCSSLVEVVIPNSVTNIGGAAFGNCTSLKKIVIPDSVKSIDDQAFHSCTSLAEVEISNSITVINQQVFYGCTSLKNIVIPDSVTIIESNAFYGCTSLDIEIPNSVIDIYNKAFYNVPHITYHGTAIGSPWGALSIN